jgi:hypothetical protein
LCLDEAIKIKIPWLVKRERGVNKKINLLGLDVWPHFNGPRFEFGGVKTLMTNFGKLYKAK